MRLIVCDALHALCFHGMVHGILELRQTKSEKSKVTKEQEQIKCKIIIINKLQ
jgi:hypothetical protein